jgi:hypothetical protein
MVGMASVSTTDALKHSLGLPIALDFSRESARFIYGAPETNAERDKLCRRVLNAIAAAPSGLTQTGLQDALSRNVDADKLRTVLAHLQAIGTLTQTEIKTR